MEEQLKTLILGKEYELLILMMQNNPSLAQEFAQWVFNHSTIETWKSFLEELQFGVTWANVKVNDDGTVCGASMCGIVMATKAVVGGKFPYEINSEYFPNLEVLKVSELESKLVINRPLKTLWIDWSEKIFNLDIKILPINILCFFPIIEKMCKIQGTPTYFPYEVVTELIIHLEDILIILQGRMGVHIEELLLPNVHLIGVIWRVCSQDVEYILDKKNILFKFFPKLKTIKMNGDEYYITNT